MTERKTRLILLSSVLLFALPARSSKTCGSIPPEALALLLRFFLLFYKIRLLSRALYAILTEIDRKDGFKMLGKRIAELRHRAGLSQAALADRIHISASALGMYEQGRRSPSAEILVALAAELGVSTDELLLAPAADSQSLVSCLPLSTSINILLQHPHHYAFSREDLTVLCLALLMDT